jgi:hypothetical protein
VSVQTTRNIFCDDRENPGPCHGWLETDDDAASADPTDDARRGWKRITVNGRKLDICPQHAERRGL